jgi:hypothetical protein
MFPGGNFVRAISRRINKENLLFNSIQGIFMSLVMSAAVLFIRNVPFQFFEFVISLCKAYIIVCITGLIVPVGFISRFTAKKLNVAFDTLRFGIIQGIVATFVYTTIVGTIIILLEVGFSNLFWKEFLPIYPIFLVIGFIVGCLTVPITKRLTSMLLLPRR